ncbi:protein-disulfide reductase DsbD family protein [Ancylobacter sp. MQZ15Z-1]|uniref:Protein-disulfide reductase DsbD family protein n=1 Tax=Ancylobacter mangrovi TaxID=2972472 RepID=A0A9X2PPR4_9HYPH|nr:protein-disulfide reductase DsbD domain-containing protein [Ancylobacter mangrovi]MCS0497563.1 protein-disulfide reductase DsbD family protein [Ancylobacter mangrovi]
MVMSRSFPIVLALFATAALVPFGTRAARAEAASDWSAPDGTAVRLIGGPADHTSLTGGVEIRLAPGWKTYWRYPGDAGVPPHFDWSGSQNVGGVKILWPAPIRFDEGGSLSIGYKKDVVIPIEVTPTDAAKPVTLKLNLDFAVCEKICQPANATLSLDLPPGGDAPSPALAAALASVPKPATLGATGTPAIETAVLEQAGDDKSIRIEAKTSNADHADLFVEGPDESWALPLPTREAGPDGKIVFVLPVDGVPDGADIATTPLRFTLTDGSRAVEVEAPLSTH